MKRKILSLVLVAAMLVSMVIFAPTAGAETQAAVSTTSAVGGVGDTVMVDLELTVDQTAGIQLAFMYDTSRLSYEGIVYVAKDMGGNAANAPQNLQFSQHGPYNFLQAAFVDADNKTVILDCAEGMTIATMLFTIKEDAPLGDAYVEFCTLRGEYNGVAYTYDQINRGAELGSTTNITYTGSVVTVLPADYQTTFPAVDEDWDFEDGVIYGMTNEAAAGFTGILAIPSQIGGVDVVEIAGAAFDGYEASTIIIPATVEYVAAGAIYNCANLTSVYVLGSEVEFEDAAIGYEGSWRSGKLRNPAIILNADETGALTTFYAAAGSTAQAYAEAGDGVDVFPFVESAGMNTISFNGSSYLVGAITKAPGTAIVGDKLAVAWKAGDNTYAAGSTITLTGDLALEAVTITAPQTSTSVDFKLTAEEKDLAMRFTSTLAKEDYAKLAGLGTVELGMLITPAAYVAKAGSFTKEALDAIGAKNGGYVDIEIDGYYNVTDTDYILAGSLKGFSAATLAKNPDFAAIAYATVTTEDGAVLTIYGDFNFDANQDVKSIATALSTSDKLMDTQKGWLANLVTKFGA